MEKNQSIPAVGTRNGLKTQKQIRPGMDSDFIKIPVYEGEHSSEGTRAIYNEHVTDIRISGADLPSLLPENSDVDLTVNIDRSEKITVTAYFPYLDYSTEIEVDSTKTSIETSWLEKEIRKAKGSVEELKQNGSSDDAKLLKIESELERLEKSFENNKNDVDGKQEVLTNLRKSLKAIDALNETTEWPILEEELKEEFYKLEKANTDLGNEKSTQLVNEFRSQLEEVIKVKDVKLGTVLLEEISSFFFQLTMIYQLIGMLRNFNDNFGNYSWSDPNRARQLVNNGISKISENPDTEELRQILVALFDMLPQNEVPSGDSNVLVG